MVVLPHSAFKPALLQLQMGNTSAGPHLASLHARVNCALGLLQIAVVRPAIKTELNQRSSLTRTDLHIYIKRLRPLNYYKLLITVIISMQNTHHSRPSSLHPNKENTQANNQVHLLRRPIKNILKKNNISSSPQKSESTFQRYKQVEGNLILKNYGKDILCFLKSNKQSVYQARIMDRHKIPHHMRAKMVDWMVEVIASYKFSQLSFFSSVRLMDSFFKMTPKVQEVGDLHLLGVACMFAACKFQEIYPFKISTVYQKIGHRKLSKQQIVSKQHQIFNLLQFQLLGSGHFDLASLLLVTLANQRFSEKALSCLNKSILYLSKMICYELQLLQSFTHSQLAAGVLFVSLKIGQQVQRTPKAQSFQGQISKRLSVQQKDVMQCASKILNTAKLFEKHFPGLENLKKFNGIKIEVEKQ